MKTLTFDLGTSLGWCFADGDVYDAGVLDLSGSRFEGAGMRFLRFRQQLRDLLKLEPDQVAYEEVHRHLGTAAAHVYGGLLAVLQEECTMQGIPYEGIPVGTIKKHATGKGNCNKEAMVAAAEKLWPHIEIQCHDQADAMHIAHLVQNRKLI